MTFVVLGSLVKLGIVAGLGYVALRPKTVQV